MWSIGRREERFSIALASPNRTPAGLKSEMYLQRFFGNSRERLLLSLLGDGQLTEKELKLIKSAIAETSDDVREKR